MHHSTQDLILAAHVRELASRWLIADTPAQLPDADARRHWRREHMDEYLAGATHELVRVAGLMKSVQSVAETRYSTSATRVDSQPAALHGNDDMIFVNGKPLSAVSASRQ